MAFVNSAAPNIDPASFEGKVPPIDYQPYIKGQYTYVKDESDLKRLAETLSKESVLGIDLENHSKYSYNGYLCLMQITTELYQTYLIDLIAIKRSVIREVLGASVLQNASITKVFHGCLHSDVAWLQRDFGLILVNVVDTQELQRYLDMGSQNTKQKKSANLSLVTLWKKYCGAEKDHMQFLSKSEKEAYQLADWAVRPLKESMLNYAAHDSHYLIHIAYQQLRQIKDGEDIKELLLDINARVLSTRYRPREEAFSPEGYRHYVLKKLMTFYDVESEDFLMTDHVCRSLYAVREEAAKELDINPEVLIENSVLYSISQKRPNNEELLIENLAEVGVTAKELERLSPYFSKLLESIVQSKWDFGDHKANIIAHYKSKEESKKMQHLKIKQKEERKVKIQEQFSCKKQVYENCRMMAPDGEMLSNCDSKKVQWYLDKGLAEIVSQAPLTIKLKFEPNGRSTSTGKQQKEEGVLTDDHFYTVNRQNQCVVCGSDKDFSRFHVVPSLYRQNFPDEMKSHRSHDVVLLCFTCHEKASQQQEALKKKLAEQYNIPLNEKNPSTQLATILQNIVKLANSLKKVGHKMPANKQREAVELIQMEMKNNKDRLRDVIPADLFAKYTSKQCKQEDLVSFCLSLPIPKLSNKDRQNPHGQSLVIMLGKDKLEDFVKLWRSHFLETMQPQYLPKGWRVDHAVERSFGIHSKFRKENGLGNGTNEGSKPEAHDGSIQVAD